MNRKPAIGIGIAVAIAALGLAALASDSARTEKPAAVDAQEYADFMAHETLDLRDLAEGAEIQRRTFNRMTPPGLSWVQTMFPLTVPFDAVNFDEKFLNELLGEDRNSVAVYPLTLALDPKTRETWIYNAEGKPIAALPSEKTSRAWPEGSDPARVVLRLDLLPAEDVEPYLYVEDRIADSLAAVAEKAAKPARKEAVAKSSLSGGQFGFADAQKLTNGNFRLAVTNGPAAAEIFSYTIWHTSSVVVSTWTNDLDEVVVSTNVVWTPVSPPYAGLERAWDVETTNLILTNGVGDWEDASTAGSARVRFYGAAQSADSDEDGLTDGAEIFLHRTDPALADTDGDGMDDAEEIQVYGTAPTRADTDQDGMTDGWEIENGFDPFVDDGNQDADDDGWTNAQEQQDGTDPHLADTDGDGMNDGEDEFPATKCCDCSKELIYTLPSEEHAFQDGTGNHVYAFTVSAQPTNYMGEARYITNVVLSGYVDDCFKIDNDIGYYNDTLGAKSFTNNITASVCDRQNGWFDVLVYDYINAGWPSNSVALNGSALIQYVATCSVEFSAPRDMECWSQNGTYDADARLIADSYSADHVDWSIATIEGAPASINANGLVTYGNGGGRYRIRATPDDLPTCYDTLNLVVPKVDIEQDATNVCKTCGCSVTVNATSNSYSPGGYVWSSAPAGISGRGASITFIPSSLNPGTYTVFAKSAAHPECYDTCTVNVLKVETAFADPDDANWGDLEEKKVILSDKDTRIKIKVTPQLADLQTIFYAIGTTVKIKTSGTAPNGQDFTMTSQNTTLVQGSGYSELRVALTRSQLISLGVLPSQESDSVTEKAWYDTGFDTTVSAPNLLDGQAFNNGMSAEIRGQCTQAIYGGLDSTPPNSPLDNSFFKAGGVEIITAECCSGVSDKRQLMNQADYFYYSGHGFIATGAVYPGGPSDVIDYWDKDLDVVIFAGCSVLDINDYNNNTNGAAHLASPGEQWEPTGPALFLGYNWKAPTDLQNSDGIISSWLSNRGSLGNIGAWEEANDNMNGHNACAIEAGSTYYYFEKTEILGVSFWDWTSVPKSSW